MIELLVAFLSGLLLGGMVGVTVIAALITGSSEDRHAGR